MKFIINEDDNTICVIYSSIKLKELQFKLNKLLQIYPDYYIIFDVTIDVPTPIIPNYIDFHHSVPYINKQSPSTLPFQPYCFTTNT